MAWGNDQVRDRVIRTILGEAAPTPESMISVAHVMKNRADSGAWGQPNGGLTRAIMAPLQFSVWNNGAQPARGVSTSDPRYIRAGQIADSVFGGAIPDNTGGATHYYAPSGMKGGAPPDWAVGQTPTATIGGQHFYRLPLTASNTAGTAATSPSTVYDAPSTAPAPAPAAASIAPIQSFTGGDYGRQATAAKQPFSGIVIHIAGKPDLQSELTYNRTPDATRGNAYYGYHYIVDRDGKVYQTAPDDVRTNHIMGNAEKGLNNENAIGVAFVGGAPAGKNPLPMTPEQQAAGVALVNQLKAKYNIDPSKIVSHGELDTSRIKGLNPDGGAEGADFIKAYRSGSAPVAASATPAPNPDAPAPQSQPIAAVAPPGSPPIPGGGQNPPAGFVGPGSDKYSLVKGMTTGVGRTPQLTMAANWGNLFGGGGGTPPAQAPAAAAPAPTPAPPAPPALTPAPGETVGGPLSPVLSNFGADQPYGPRSLARYGTGPGDLGMGDPRGLTANTPGAPSMGYPAMTNPFGEPPPQQVSQLPGSLLSSAQDLIKRLFPPTMTG